MYNLPLEDVYNILAEHQLLKNPTVEKERFNQANEAVVFTYLSYDSRKLKEHTLFFCKGINFTADLLQSAVAQGVRFYLSEVHYDVPAYGILVTDIREAMAVVAQAFYKQPQDKLYKVGITGTKGKTTAAYFIKKTLDSFFKERVALFSSEETCLDGVTFLPSKLTTPEALDLYYQMAVAVENGLTHLVMEVSSQAYKTKRVHHLTFETGIFLNISPDHISPIEHATFEEYFACKCQLLANSKQMILNHDDDHFEILQKICQDTQVPYYSFGRSGGQYRIQETSDPRSFVLMAEDDSLQANGTYQINLYGDFNHDNATAAILAARLAGTPQTNIEASLPTIHIPGRMNLLKKPNGAYIFVDYAHNYLSIKAMGDFAKQLRPAGRVIIVTGSAGDKALSRRADIGRALSESADVAIITSDDPGYEDPADIAQEILATLVNPEVEVHLELERGLAVKQAFQLAQPQDTIIIAGKGTEQMMKVRGVEIPYEGDFHLSQRLIQENQANI